jgi:hypothetical protein
VEFVAYRGEPRPYYRFLHEDTMGSTIATTHPHDCFGACLTGRLA